MAAKKKTTTKKVNAKKAKEAEEGSEIIEKKNGYSTRNTEKINFASVDKKSHGVKNTVKSRSTHTSTHRHG